jgi:hypothetical protein
MKTPAATEITTSATRKRNCRPQLEMFDASARSAPIAPKRHSNAWLALYDMATHGPITHLDWNQSGRGWRLAAAIKECRYLNWVVLDEWVHPSGMSRSIKRYRLSHEFKTLALEVLA